MSDYFITGIAPEFAQQVRDTMRSPEYGHLATRELARGTGPCRVCLRRFAVGAEERILFTYRPAAGDDTTGAPGPVFIHAEACAQYRGDVFPEDLHSLPIILEAHTASNRVPEAVRLSGAQADGALHLLFARPEIRYVHVRHGEAGCHIARVDRGEGATGERAATDQAA